MNEQLLRPLWDGGERTATATHALESYGPEILGSHVAAMRD